MHASPALPCYECAIPGRDSPSASASLACTPLRHAPERPLLLSGQMERGVARAWPGEGRRARPPWSDDGQRIHALIRIARRARSPLVPGSRLVLWRRVLGLGFLVGDARQAGRQRRGSPGLLRTRRERGSPGLLFLLPYASVAHPSLLASLSPSSQKHIASNQHPQQTLFRNHA